MIKILANSLAKKVFLLSVFGILIYSCANLQNGIYPTRNHKNITHNRINANLEAVPATNQENKMLDEVPQHPTLAKNTQSKNKVLNQILNNDSKRKKFEYIMGKAAELKLPTALALIPVIESEYNNKAISPKGAGGLWQLMPSTAKIFGLSKSQRFEMVGSTRAALLHLRDLYNEFGNWEFAIAAYNAGDGTVSKALRRNSHAKTVHDLELPRETKNYVLAFLKLQKEFRSYSVA